MEQTMIEITNLVKNYHEVCACDHVSFTVQKGDLTCILGKSGSGKSTLLSLIAGYTLADAGKIIVDGKDITHFNEKEKILYRRKTIGMIFQFFHLVDELSVYENIVLPVYLAGETLDLKWLDHLAETLEIKALFNKQPYQCSGGQQQRIAIARALMNHPKILLADEPTGNLDSKNTDALIHLLKQIHRDFNLTLLMVTHDLSAAQIANRILEIKDGRIAADYAYEN